MANNQRIQFIAGSKQDETIFIFRVIGIKELHRVLVVESGASFFERNAVFFDIGFFFRVIPFEF
jgi:hypothetical protein